MEWLGTAIEKFGIPTGVLLVLLLFIWRAGVWIRDKIATPIVDKHLSLISKIEANDDKQTASLASLAESNKRQTEILGQLACLNGRLRGE